MSYVHVSTVFSDLLNAHFSEYEVTNVNIESNDSALRDGPLG